jgi:hypothetical protein
MPDISPNAQLAGQLDAWEKHLFLSDKQPEHVFSFKSSKVPEYPVTEFRRDSLESHTLLLIFIDIIMLFINYYCL